MIAPDKEAEAILELIRAARKSARIAALAEFEQIMRRVERCTAHDDYDKGYIEAQEEMFSTLAALALKDPADV